MTEQKQRFIEDYLLNCYSKTELAEEVLGRDGAPGFGRKLPAISTAAKILAEAGLVKLRWRLAST